MWTLMCRLLAVAAMAFAPLAVATVVTPAVSSAQCADGEWWDAKANLCRPPDATLALPCEGGQWWDPTGNVCRPLGVGPQPLGCPGGEWWDPTANVCRPLNQGPQPLACDNGWWWDPISNACRPPLLP